MGVGVFFRGGRYSFWIMILVIGAFLLAQEAIAQAWRQPAAQDALDQASDQLSDACTGNSAAARIQRAPDGVVVFAGSPPGEVFLGQNTVGTPESIAKDFLKEHAKAFGISAASTLNVIWEKQGLGRTYVRLQQYIDGMPVFGGQAIVQVGASGGVECVVSDLSRHLGGMDIRAARDKNTAIDLAMETIAGLYGAHPLCNAEDPELMIFSPLVLGMPGLDRLVWQMEIVATDGALIKEMVMVDAENGNVPLHYTLIQTSRDRKIYDAANTESDPGTLVRTEGHPACGIADADQAYDFFGDTYNFYKNEHGRDSIDGHGYTISATVRYCYPYGMCPWENAVWDGTRMYFGQGYAAADDVVAHELTHGVTQYESDLIYAGQSGAINESFSDIWGEFVDLTNGHGTDAPAVRWSVGEDLPMGAIRSMSDPPLYENPDSTCSPYWYGGLLDNGGVHINSGVGNKLCYLLTDGGSFNGETITAMGIPQVADLFYEVQVNLLTSAADYVDLSNALAQAAVNLNLNQTQRDNVAAACRAVRITRSTICQLIYECPSGLPMDGSFEEGPGSGNWTEQSTNFYTPLCNASCGPGGGTGPHTGGYWCWFGGVSGLVEDGSISQSIVIPSSSYAMLNFYLEIPVALTTGYMMIRVDDTTVFRVTKANADTYHRYALVSIDLSNYADGASHLLWFRGYTDAGPGPLNFFVDDLCLDLDAGEGEGQVEGEGQNEGTIEGQEEGLEEGEEEGEGEQEGEDNSCWSALGNGMAGLGYAGVLTMAADDSGNVYAGGYFNTAGGISASHIAKWDGETWSNLGTGMSNYVNAVVIDPIGAVYAGGNFAMAGGITVNNIAKWDGANWTGVGTGTDNYVNSIVIDKSGTLYAGGNFSMAGGVNANYIAKWNGVSWAPLGLGLGRPVEAIVVDESGTLYVGGQFSTAGGITVNNIAKWDGETWSPLGAGMNHTVNTLAMDGSGNLYAGGYFTIAGGANANFIAKWDGMSWTALGQGVDFAVESITFDSSGNLYCGGRFTTAGETIANYIAKWDGERWSSLESGMSGGSPPVLALAIDSRENLYAGGYFTMAATISVRGIGMWECVRSEGEGVEEGIFEGEGAVEGEGQLEGEGSIEGEGEGQAEGMTEGGSEGAVEEEGGMDGEPEGSDEEGEEVEPLVIIQQPRGASLYAGMSWVASILVEGGVGTIGYDWKKNGVSLGWPNAMVHLAGPLTEEDAGAYRCTVTDDITKLESEVANLAVYSVPLSGQHDVDQNGNWTISLSELLRVVQFFNSNGFYCNAASEDGYAPGPGDQTCSAYDADYSPQDWHITLSEVLRIIQFFNSICYHVQAGTEDGYAPGAGK
ncbi:MAG TPA: M4 family metallopeptidase [Candidatus Hydrogenedentes bacterium]|nr:M4 family metallopeptidase [Candidatus Hydrogenedentota bacterium]